MDVTTASRVIRDMHLLLGKQVSIPSLHIQTAKGKKKKTGKN